MGRPFQCKKCAVAQTRLKNGDIYTVYPSTRQFGPPLTLAQPFSTNILSVDESTTLLGRCGGGAGGFHWRDVSNPMTPTVESSQCFHCLQGFVKEWILFFVSFTPAFQLTLEFTRGIRM